MHIHKMVFIVLAAASLAACSSAQNKASKAQAESYKAAASVSQERVNLIDQYQKCVDKAGADNTKVEACDSYLKAAEALK